MFRMIEILQVSNERKLTVMTLWFNYESEIKWYKYHFGILS